MTLNAYWDCNCSDTHLVYVRDAGGWSTVVLAPLNPLNRVREAGPFARQPNLMGRNGSLWPILAMKDDMIEVGKTCMGSICPCQPHANGICGEKTV